MDTQIEDLVNLKERVKEIDSKIKPEVIEEIRANVQSNKEDIVDIVNVQKNHEKLIEQLSTKQDDKDINNEDMIQKVVDAVIEKLGSNITEGNNQNNPKESYKEALQLSGSSARVPEAIHPTGTRSKTNTPTLHPPSSIPTGTRPKTNTPTFQPPGSTPTESYPDFLKPERTVRDLLNESKLKIGIQFINKEDIPAELNIIDAYMSHNPTKGIMWLVCTSASRSKPQVNSPLK